MQKRVKELADTDHGSISIGGSSYASYLILSDICSEFYKKHPKIKVSVDLGNVGSPLILHEMLDNRELDILITYGSQNRRLILEPLFEERLVIAMNKNTPGAEKLQHLALTRDEILTKSYSPDREIEDMSIFHGVEFLEFSRKSDISLRMSKILGDYRPSHYKINNARHSEMHYNLMSAGIGAVLTNSPTIFQKPYDENILFFMPKSKESYRKIFLAYNSSSNNNRLIKSFVKVAKEFYSKNI